MWRKPPGSAHNLQFTRQLHSAYSFCFKALQSRTPCSGIDYSMAKKCLSRKICQKPTGLHPVRVYQCRIPEEAVSGSPLEIATGDKITCGDITATVLDWHDNRGRPSPHWYVEAS